MHCLIHALAGADAASVHRWKNLWGHFISISSWHNFLSTSPSRAASSGRAARQDGEKIDIPKDCPAHCRLLAVCRRRQCRCNSQVLKFCRYVKRLESCNSAWHSPQGYPPLIDATIDTLAEGLACKKFTSVDLVKVSVHFAWLGTKFFFFSTMQFRILVTYL